VAGVTPAVTLLAAAKRRCWRVDEWPELDRIAWNLALTPGDPFKSGGLGATYIAPAGRQLLTPINHILLIQMIFTS